MANLNEIKAAIHKLPEDKIGVLLDRLQTHIDDMWDRQIESDIESGKLDFLIGFWNVCLGASDTLSEQAHKAYRLWQSNQLDPSLYFKELGKNIWSFHLAQDYRLLAIKKGKYYCQIWSGNHKAYNALLNRLYRISGHKS